MVDWSGGNRRRAGKQDCIWIAHGPATVASPKTVSPPSRTEAEQIIRSLLQSIVTSNGRVLLCADFGYGYPAGFAALLQKSVPTGLPPWRIVWEYLTKQVQDDLGTKPGAKPTNCSNRFEVANAINAAVSSPSFCGPFWGLFKSGAYACVPQKRPAQPFTWTGAKIASLRITDKRAKSDTPFRLFGTGSVGSQVLTVSHDSTASDLILNSPAAPPFGPLRPGGRPGRGCGSIHSCESFTPRSIPGPQRESLTGTIKDRGQVCAMLHWARDLDAMNLLVKEFAIPPGITSGSQDDIVIRSEEGWILGCLS